jgi:hypothetical protein
MDLKTSLLVSKQLPEFVRDEYPLFVSFLEAYYEFLETERYTDIDGNIVSQKNNLIEKLKDLKNLSDIDYSLDDFEDQFFNTFISYLPKDTLISKDFLIKNILPLYQTKGTQKSFEYLFRLLFGEEIQIEYPGEKILRASNGKWTIENILRTELEIYNEYIFDGTQTTFDLPYKIESSQLQVTIDGVITEDYYVRKELQKLYLNFTPSINSNIKIYYLGVFNISIFKNRQILGKLSNSTTVIEKTARRNIAGLNFYQFFVDERNTSGTFRNGEIIEIQVFNSNNKLISFYLQTLSDVRSIEITESGSGYNIGDQAILRGSATERAVAVVDSISSGNIESLSVKVGNFGAGYKVDNEVYANGYTSNVFSAIIDAVDDSGTISPNTFTYFDELLISDYLTINISDPDYGFPSTNVAEENLSTIISDAFISNIITNLGPATNVSVTLSQIASNSNVEFFANSTLLYDDVRISDFNSIGTIKILNPGTGYSVGDRIIFTNTEYFSGQGAKAFVSAVNSSGGINRVTVEDGGYNYKREFLPTLTVDSSGTNAVLEVEHFMGQDVDFTYVSGDGIQGKVLSIKVLNPGKGYTVTPVVDLTLSGDGQAKAVANIRSSFVKLPGRWLTSDSLLSDDEIRLQGKDYYVDFSYIISSQIEFQRYKSIVKDLLNPVGSVNYARYLILDKIDPEIKYLVFDEFSRQLAGTVNVISELSTVWGTNTYFEIANDIGLIAEGTYILVNSEIRIINAIINNTTLTVSEPYEYSANDQLVTIVPVPYRAITTEYLRELSINIEGPRTIVLTTEEDY